MQSLLRAVHSGSAKQQSAKRITEGAFASQPVAHTVDRALRMCHIRHDTGQDITERCAVQISITVVEAATLLLALWWRL